MLAEIIEQSGERRELATDGRGRQVAGHSPNYVHLAKQRRDFAVEAERIFVVVQEAHQESVDAHTALWMPTLSAVRVNPWLRAYYQRLRAADKLAKVALVAAMRMLMAAVYSVARHRRPLTLAPVSPPVVGGAVTPGA